VRVGLLAGHFVVLIHRSDHRNDASIQRQPRATLNTSPVRGSASAESLSSCLCQSALKRSFRVASCKRWIQPDNSLLEYGPSRLNDRDP
jgi:hypothetical protein